MTKPILTLGDAARGSIQPFTSQQDTAADLETQLMAGEFYTITNETVPRKCIDGRSPDAGFKEMAPNSAGGTETLLVASELVGLKGTTGDIAQDFEKLLQALVQKGVPIGGHSDMRAAGETSGCGANDKLPQIIAFIAENGELLGQTAEALGVSIDTPTQQQIVDGAARSFTFADGSQMLALLRRYAGDANVDILSGSHAEVVAVINTQKGTTLNRHAIKTNYGGEVQAFNVDAWAFDAAARAITTDEATVKLLVAAMVFYNLATAFVLGGPGLHVMVR